MNEEKYPFITRKLQQAIENGSTPGVALLVDKDGELVYRHALGYAQRYPEHKDLHETTIFDVASLTKVIATTTAVMILIREHLLSLEEPVKTYIPEFPHEQITFLHLLTHSAGFPQWFPVYEEIQQEVEQRGNAFIGSSEARHYVLEKIFHTPLLAAPGEQYTYTDIGFILLGHAIDQITGMPLDEYCKKMIFAPLGMTHTFFRRQGTPLPEGDYAATERCEWRRRILYGEVHDENTYALGGVAGHAGLFSTLDDVRMFMNTLSCCYDGKDTFLPQSIVQQFFTRQYLPENSTRALGWDTPSPEASTGGELLSPTSVGHTGFTGTSIWLDLSRKLLIILFSNRIHLSRNNQKFLKMRPKIHDTVVITFDRSDA